MKQFMMLSIITLMSTWFFTSCSSDDNDDAGGDFIEISFNGKTYRKNVYGIYAQFPIGENLSVTYATEDVFEDEGFGFFYGITLPEREEDIMDLSTGSYGVTEDYTYGSDKNVLDFSADLEFYDSDEYYYTSRGSHKVTSIRNVDGMIQIEGTFDIVMEENNSYEEMKVKGKYRITAESYE